jgi:hypothetical protein
MSHGIKVPVEGSDDEYISRMCRCTSSQRWHGGDGRNDCVWVKQCQGRCSGELNGCLPWQLLRLFKIKLLNKDGAFITYWLALVLTTISENSGNLDSISKFVLVRKTLATVALQVFSVGNIVRYAHVISEIVTRRKTADECNEQWIVNCHIYQATWNDVYTC